MPWKDKTMREEKVSFIKDWESGNYTVTDLSNYYEISRQSAYNIIRRYKELGITAFDRQSRAPKTHPNKTKESVEELIINIRKKYKNWGPKKIQIILSREYGMQKIPSGMTINRILNEHGLIKKSKHIRRIKPINPIYEARKCNEIWSADFKGKFKMGNKKYCHPLTIADKYSRFIIDIKGYYSENYKQTRATFKKAFQTFGLPKQIHTDNGNPFASAMSVRRYSRLSYWFIELGVDPIFSDPGRPQQNGKHERMHKDLKAACAKPPSYNLIHEQRRLNKFKDEYNEIRPHESLGMATPSSYYKASRIVYPGKAKEYIYAEGIDRRIVTKTGALRWRSKDYVMISNALIGKNIGMEEMGEGIWRIYYRHVFLGYFNENKKERGRSTYKLYY